MGTFSVEVTIEGPTGQSATIEALVDTGSTYSFIDSQLLHRLGVVPTSVRRFRQADESVKEYPVGSMQLTYEGEKMPVVVVFAEPGVAPLLGATALENLGLGVDPVNEHLVPVDALLK